jgi:integrase
LAKLRIPKLLKHKRTGWAYVKDPRTGKQKMMGHVGSLAAEANYRQWLADYLRERAEPGRLESPSRPLVCSALWALWLDQCHERYRRADGKPTGEVGVCHQAVKLFLPFQDLHLVAFGREHLIAVRDQLVLEGKARKTIHEYLGRIVRSFTWAEARGWVQAGQLATLKKWERLRPTQAKKSRVIEAIPPLHLFRIWRYLKKSWRAVFLWHLYTGQRVETALSVRAEDIDQSMRPWRYVPVQHKGSWRGQALAVLVGPLARQALAAVPKRRPKGWLFPGKHQIKGVPYFGPVTTSGYRRAFEFAMKRADAVLAEKWARLGRKVTKKNPLPVMPRYNPRQIRHSAATWLRSHGIDEGIVGAILGHGGGSTLGTGSGSITGRYAQIHRRVVNEVVERFG